MRILTILGARPQFVKAGPVSRALAAAGIEEIVLHTGQHYDENMSGVFFDELGLTHPHINLGVGSGAHADQTGRMMVGVERAIEDHGPDWVLVYGDTNSTLAGAIAASKGRVRLAHVEAGLRSFNRRMPEEINRIIADSVSDLLFPPTPTAHANLIREGHPASRVRLVGDVMFDASLVLGDLAETRSRILERLGLTYGSYGLATVHRAENTDDPVRLRAVFRGLAVASQDLPIVLPLHPRTRRLCAEYGVAIEKLPGLRLIEPVGYLDMVRLERNATVIATDSGGVQKEAFFYRVPCVTLRDETEWVELVELGWNRLCPPLDERAVAHAILNARGTTGREASPYGDGTASRQITDALAQASA